MPKVNAGQCFTELFKKITVAVFLRHGVHAANWSSLCLNENKHFKQILTVCRQCYCCKQAFSCDL